MGSASWLKRKAGEQHPPDAAAVRELPLAALGSYVTVLVDAVPGEPDREVHARVGALDGGTIVLTDTNGATADRGTRVTVRWCIDSGERSVSATVEATNEWTWTVQATGEVIHHQRRGWVRVDTAVPLRIRQPDGQEWHEGSTVNLSCGGMAAIIGVPPEEVPAPGDTIDVELDLDAEPVALTGVVQQARPGEDRHTLRVAFGEMPEVCRQRISRHVFQVQREELARRRVVAG
jgi:PilZ domain